LLVIDVSNATVQVTLAPFAADVLAELADEPSPPRIVDE
jgi:hypothetical protein